MNEETADANGSANNAGFPPADMTQLYIGFYKKGPLWTGESTPEIESDQREHLALLFSLHQSGDLLISGPTPDGSEVRGILVCRGDSMEEVEALFAEDAHVYTGRLLIEFHPWYVATEVLHQPLFANET